MRHSQISMFSFVVVQSYVTLTLKVKSNKVNVRMTLEYFTYLCKDL